MSDREPVHQSWADGITARHTPVRRSTSGPRPAQQSAAQGTDLTVSPPGPSSIYEDRSADRNHLKEGFDVLVAQSHAPVTDRAANALGLVGAVQRVAVTHVEPVGAQNSLVLALARPEGRDHDVAARHDLPPLYPWLDRYGPAVAVLAHHVGAVDGDHGPVAGRDRLPAIEPHDPEPTLARLLHEVPVRGNPGRILLLGLDDEPASRGLELPVRLPAGRVEHLAAAG